MPSIPLKLVEQTGQREYLRVWWGRVDPATHDGFTYHNATLFLWNVPPNYVTNEGDGRTYTFPTKKITDFPNESEWPDKCDRCFEPVPKGHFLNEHGSSEEAPIYQVFHIALFDTPPRPMQPGDIFLASWMGPGTYEVVLPDHKEDSHPSLWFTTQHASNCHHDDKTPKDHRCWTVTGTPPKITVHPSIGGSCHVWIKEGLIVDA